MNGYRGFWEVVEAAGVAAMCGRRESTTIDDIRDRVNIVGSVSDRGWFMASSVRRCGRRCGRRAGHPPRRSSSPRSPARLSTLARFAIGSRLILPLRTGRSASCHVTTTRGRRPTGRHLIALVVTFLRMLQIKSPFITAIEPDY